MYNSTFPHCDYCESKFRNAIFHLHRIGKYFILQNNIHGNRGHIHRAKHFNRSIQDLKHALDIRAASASAKELFCASSVRTRHFP